jgi:hypothetical protein
MTNLPLFFPEDIRMTKVPPKSSFAFLVPEELETTYFVFIIN